MRFTYHNCDRNEKRCVSNRLSHTAYTTKASKNDSPARPNFTCPETGRRRSGEIFVRNESQEPYEAFKGLMKPFVAPYKALKVLIRPFQGLVRFISSLKKAYRALKSRIRPMDPVALPGTPPGLQTNKKLPRISRTRALSCPPWLVWFNRFGLERLLQGS